MGDRKRIFKISKRKTIAQVCLLFSPVSEMMRGFFMSIISVPNHAWHVGGGFFVPPKERTWGCLPCFYLTEIYCRPSPEMSGNIRVNISTIGTCARVKTPEAEKEILLRNRIAPPVRPIKAKLSFRAI